MTEPLSTEHNAPLAQTGRYHKLCERCKRFGQVLWEVVTLGRDLIETAKDAGFETHAGYFWNQHDFIDLGSPEELAPNFCHLYAILRAMHDAVVSMNSWIRTNNRPTILISHVLGRSDGFSLPVEEHGNPGGPRTVRFTALLKSGTKRSKGEILELSFYNLQQQWTASYNIPGLHSTSPSERASKWMQDCVANDRRCNRGIEQTISKSSRPRRLLDLAGGNVVLRFCDDIPEPFVYLTLSHMWGVQPDAQLRLTLTRLEEMHHGIPQHQISHIYKTAVKLTLNLGYRYLWIDSLCIIQDSSEDWEHEASKMADIYRNGICNLSFLSPPEAGDSSLWIDPRIYNPCILREADSSTTGLFIRPVPRANVEATAYWEWMDSTQWPLFTRAWAFHEHFLCRRTILYRHHHLAWECMNEFCDETLGLLPRPEKLRNGVHYRGAIAKDELFKKDEDFLEHIPTQSSQTGFEIWIDLILEYRARRLTFSKDRVMALVGVARRFASIHGLTYLARTFLEYMPDSLLWSIRRAPEGYTILESPAAKTPSWSWFSAPIHEDDAFQTATFYSIEGDKMTLTRVLGFQWADRVANTTPDDGFYNLSGLRLTIETTVFPAVLQTSLERNGYGATIVCYSVTYEPLLGYDYIFNPDMWETADAVNESKINIHLAVFRHVVKPGLVLADGLALVPHSDEAVWKRIGYWYALHHGEASTTVHMSKEFIRAVSEETRQTIVLV